MSIRALARSGRADDLASHLAVLATTSMTCTLPDALAAELERELGRGRVLGPGDAALADYSRDEGHEPPGEPGCVAVCESADEVAAVLRLAAARDVPVTPRGAGSGKTGGCIPRRGGIVVSTERMRALREIDADDLVAVAEPGVVTGDLAAAAAESALFYPPDPASLAYCSIGGNAATNAGGPRAFKYGVTRDYVLGLEVVLAGGERLRLGRRAAKSSSGYDLCATFVGSEGTFGVITELTLKLIPAPPAVATLLALFDDAATATAAAGLLTRNRLYPRTLELVDRAALACVRDQLRRSLPAAAGAALLVELDGEPVALEAMTERAGETCERAGALDVAVAQSEPERRDWWEARRGISRALRRAHPHKVSEDICVPRGRIAEMLRRLDRVAAESDLPVAAYGHAGDGNLHVNLLLDEPADDPAIAPRLARALDAVFRHAIELGGTLSGEHGIGTAKRRYMALEHGAAALAYQRKLAALWDPRDLVNPGKVLPDRGRPWPE